LVTFAGSGNNLVPNPYPSAINWDASSGWVKTGIANSVYIWPAGGNNYAAYVGGEATNGGTNIIPAGQAFFVKATGSPTFSMNDNVRVHGGHNFFKSEAYITDLLRIKAVSNEMTDETVIRFTGLATADADPGYDAWKLYGNDGAPQLYTLASDNQMLAINSLPYLSAVACTVPLNFEQKSTGSVSFTFSDIESFDPAIRIQLQDLKTNQTIDLRQQNTYTFDHSDGNDAQRFKVIFGGTTGVGNTNADASRLWISGHTLYINAPGYSGKAALVKVYNLTGQLILQKRMAVGQLSTVDLSLIKSSGVIARLIIDDNVLTTKGILVQ
jgi:hypothetical protein